MSVQTRSVKLSRQQNPSCRTAASRRLAVLKRRTRNCRVFQKHASAILEILPPRRPLSSRSTRGLTCDNFALTLRIASDPANYYDDGHAACRKVKGRAPMKDYLTGKVCAPEGFPYQPQTRRTKGGTRMADPYGHCSSPVTVESAWLVTWSGKINSLYAGILLFITTPATKDP